VGELVFSVGDTPPEKLLTEDDVADIVIDRLSRKDEPEFLTRLKDSLQSAYEAGEGRLTIYRLTDTSRKEYHESAACPICDYELKDLTISNFSFNSHYGACESCHGLGSEVAFLEDRIINFDLTLAEGAILPWASHPYYSKIIEEMAKRHKIPMNVPYAQLKKEHKHKVLYGTPGEHYEIVPDSKYGD
jgi:excinuclease ABC subunit A